MAFLFVRRNKYLIVCTCFAFGVILSFQWGRSRMNHGQSFGNKIQKIQRKVFYKDSGNSSSELHTKMEDWLKKQHKGSKETTQENNDKLGTKPFSTNYVRMTAQMIVKRTKDVDNSRRDTNFKISNDVRNNFVDREMTTDKINNNVGVTTNTNILVKHIDNINEDIKSDVINTNDNGDDDDAIDDDVEITQEGTLETLDKTDDMKNETKDIKTKTILGSEAATEDEKTTTISPEIKTEKQIQNDEGRSTSQRDPESNTTSLPKLLTQTNIEPTSTPSLKLFCKLPKLDIFDPAIRHLVYDQGNDPKCWRRYPPAFYKMENGRLVALKDNLTQLIQQDTIKLSIVNRGADHYSYYTTGINPFNETVQRSRALKSDFIKLSYRLVDGSERQYLYAHVAPQRVPEGEMGNLRSDIKGSGDTKGLPVNVIIVGFDSTSAANFRRKMKRSITFLEKKLNAYVLNGMSIVGDATTPNLAVMLTGKREEDLPEARKGFYHAEHIDSWPWVFKKFKRKGYMTLFAEDDPSVAAFNLRLKGFHNPPTHHYMRPFWHMVDDDSVHRDEHNLCFRQESMTNYTLKYLSSFLQAYPRDTPLFGMGFMSYLAHAHPNHLSLVDDDLVNFLEDFLKHGHHNNTILIVMSDHGSRNDDVRDTIQGKLEERLPWFSVVLPPWFKERYPEIDRNLRHNEDIIASPFDVHATFLHLLNYPLPPDVEKGQSLFSKLNPQRTCKDAGIDTHWCPCLSWSYVNTTSRDVQLGAQAAVDYFNSLNSKVTDKCAKLKLQSITRASFLEAGSVVQIFSSTNQDTDRRVNLGSKTHDRYKRYDITLMTSPGGGKFEVTIGINRRQEVTVNPNISRINRYGNQPDCIAEEYPYIRKYCYCKEHTHSR